MLKSKILIIHSIILTLVLCIHLNGYSIAGDCDEPGRGGDTPTALSTPTVSGDHNYSENWNPELQFDPSNPDEIDRNSSIPINVIGGCPPYTLSVSGNGFSLTGNTLFADDTACGSATINVTDYCGNNATGYVRSTTGIWTQISSCNNIGVGKCPSWFCKTTHIDGKYKYDQNWLYVPIAPPYCENVFTNCDDCGCISTYDKVGPGVGVQCPPNHPYFCRCSHVITYEWECAP